MPLRYGLTALGALGALSAAAGTRRVPGPGLLVTVRTGAVIAPDSALAGWTRVRVEEDGRGHILVVFRLPDAATAADVRAFVAALDTARATPKPALALGGPEIGDTGEVVIQLRPGRYVLGCVTRGRDGHRHASSGETKVILVTKSSLASGPEPAAPVATQDIGMVDFAYVGPERWSAGSHMLRVENRGRQDHQVRLGRLRAGATLETWLHADNPDTQAQSVAGVARMGPGAVAYLPVELRPGSYLLYCLIPDAASGRPHVMLGMLRAIQVE